MCVAIQTMMMIATVASAGVNAYASIQSGNAEYAAGMQNAEIATRNAQAAEDEIKNTQDAAAIERRRLGEKVRAERGALVAKYANMGLDTQFGTPADLVGDTQRAYEIDRSILARNEENATKALDKQKADYLTSASQSRAAAKGARKAGQLAALGSFLDAGSTIAGRWTQPGAAARPKSGASSFRAPGGLSDYNILRVGG